MAPKWCTRMGSNHRRARLQRAALPLSYLCEMERPAGIEPIVPTQATWRSTIELQPQILVGRDGFEPPQNERRFYGALGSPVPSLPGSCEGVVPARQAVRKPIARSSLRKQGPITLGRYDSSQRYGLL